MAEIIIKSEVSVSEESDELIIEMIGYVNNLDRIFIKSEYCGTEIPQCYVAMDEINDNTWRCVPLLTTTKIVKSIPAGEKLIILRPAYSNKLI